MPSPDGKKVALGKAVGGTHGAVIHVLDVDRGDLLPDRPHGESHETRSWRPDGSGFFYAAGARWNAVYEHRLGSDAPARVTPPYSSTA